MKTFAPSCSFPVITCHQKGMWELNPVLISRQGISLHKFFRQELSGVMLTKPNPSVAVAAVTPHLLHCNR
jgi:hypothetical protein